MKPNQFKIHSFYKGSYYKDLNEFACVTQKGNSIIATYKTEEAAFDAWYDLHMPFKNEEQFLIRNCKGFIDTDWHLRLKVAKLNIDTMIGTTLHNKKPRKSIIMKW